MTSTRDSQLIHASTPALYSYANSTCNLQVIRIANVPNYYFERVIFPKQRLLFEAQSNAELEVYTSEQGQAILLKKIPVNCLKVE